MTKDRKLKILLSVIVLVISMVTYLSTVAPTVSFWDCGEFIACANILGVPHPPGTPLFMLLGRAFILFFGWFDEIAYRVNLLSVFGSAFGVMFAFLFTEKLVALITQAKSINWVTATGGLVAALLVNFSDTYWFNAVEAEVYGIAMFLVMLISWLSLIWVENKDNAWGQKCLLLICYLAFLGVGFHLYTVMTVPAIFVLMLLVEPKYRTNWPIIATGVFLLSVVYAIGSFILITTILFVILLGVYLMAQSNRLKSQLNLSMWFCVLAVAGFSTYAYIPIRSALDPRIDENNPEIHSVFDYKSWDTFRAFVERKQYGSESMLRRALHRRGNLANQVFSHPHMGYGGYMLAQYFPWKVGYGRSQPEPGKLNGQPTFTPTDNDPVELLGMKFRTQMEIMPPYSGRLLQAGWFLLFHLVFFYIGWTAYKRNKTFGIYLALLYVLSSFGLIFYMNFSDGLRPDLGPYQQWIEAGKDPSNPPAPVHMEVRERDYFYVPAFIFMSVLLGVGAAFAVGWLKQRFSASVAKGSAVALLVVSFVVPCFSNYYEHDRSKVWVPYDYARNLLMSCRPNGILFTNGDNDTFPLWFMQEVENFRRDVRVVNLSLGNTDWYILQLLDQEPKVTLGYTREQIKNMGPQLNQLTKPAEFKLGKTGLSVTLEPREKKSYYKVQDYLVLNIVQNNYPERPIHFAATVSTPNMMGLEKYMVLEGMVYTVTDEIRNQALSPERTAYLVDSVFWYRGLMDSNANLDNDTKGLLSNYFATNHQLARHAQEQVAELRARKDALQKNIPDTTAGDGDSASAVDSPGAAGQATLDSIDRAIDSLIAYGKHYINKTGEIMSWDWRNYYFGSQFYSGIEDYETAQKLLEEGLKLGKREQAMKVALSQVYMEQDKFDEAEPLLVDLQKEEPDDFQVLHTLLGLYEKQEKYGEAMAVVESWLQENPSHQYAPYMNQKLATYQSKSKPSGSLPFAPGPSDEGNQKTSTSDTAPGDGHQKDEETSTGDTPGDSG